MRGLVVVLLVGCAEPMRVGSFCLEAAHAVCERHQVCDRWVDDAERSCEAAWVSTCIGDTDNAMRDAGLDGSALETCRRYMRKWPCDVETPDICRP